MVCPTAAARLQWLQWRFVILRAIVGRLRGARPDAGPGARGGEPALGTSHQIGEYYRHKRDIPLANLCLIDTAADETIERPVYEKEIEGPVGVFLKKQGLQEKILYIVLTSGVPLRINGPGDELRSEASSVDSEMTLLYQRLRGAVLPLAGPLNNPFFRQRDAPFRHPLFPMYLVTRLDGYNMADMQALVDRALEARNRGRFVIDLKARETNEGNQWLRTAALLLPQKPGDPR